MGDLFFHLGFARRLRKAEGMHPIVVEAMVRRPLAVSVGATLPLLPGLERPKISWWRKLFFGAADPDLEWVERLRGARASTAGLPLAMLTAEPGGPMMRFALGLGAIAYEVSHQAVAPLNRSVEAAQRDAVARAQARLWLQSVIPTHKDFEGEWRPAVINHDDDHLQRLVDTVDTALRKAHGEAVGSDHLRRWLRALSDRVTPVAESSESPPSLGMADHDAKGPHFEEPDFIGAVQGAVDWFVSLSHEIAPKYVGGEPTGPDLEQILLEGDTLRRPESIDLNRAQQRAKMDINSLRAEHLGRGRNDKPAFDEQSMPPIATPGVTPPLNVDETAPVPVPPGGHAEAQDEPASVDETVPVPAAPADTQQVSVADIQEEMAARSPAPESGGFDTPANTQAVSIAQIEEEMATASEAESAEPAAAAGEPAGDAPAEPPAPEEAAAPEAAATAEAAATSEEAAAADEPAAPEASSEEAAPEGDAAEASAPDAGDGERPKTPPMGTPKPKTPPLGTPASMEASPVDEGEAEAPTEPAEAPADAAAPAAEEAKADEPAGANGSGPSPSSGGPQLPDTGEVEETMRFPVPPPSQDKMAEDEHEETMRFPVPPKE